MTTLLQPGKLVSLRGREWIVLPSEDNDLLIVKPLGGSFERVRQFQGATIMGDGRVVLVINLNALLGN